MSFDRIDRQFRKPKSADAEDRIALLRAAIQSDHVAIVSNVPGDNATGYIEATPRFAATIEPGETVSEGVDRILREKLTVGFDAAAPAGDRTVFYRYHHRDADANRPDHPFSGSKSVPTETVDCGREDASIIKRTSHQRVNLFLSRVRGTVGDVVPQPTREDCREWLNEEVHRLVRGYSQALPSVADDPAAIIRDVVRALPGACRTDVVRSYEINNDALGVRLRITTEHAFDKRTADPLRASSFRKIDAPALERVVTNGFAAKAPPEPNPCCELCDKFKRDRAVAEMTDPWVGPTGGDVVLEPKLGTTRASGFRVPTPTALGAEIAKQMRDRIERYPGMTEEKLSAAMRAFRFYGEPNELSRPVGVAPEELDAWAKDTDTRQKPMIGLNYVSVDSNPTAETRPAHAPIPNLVTVGRAGPTTPLERG